jgi:hypothetical protein
MMGERKMQKTPKGHEIPIPQREEFLHDPKKAVKASPSTLRHPSLPPLPPNTYSSTVVRTLTVAFPLGATEQSNKKEPRQIRRSLRRQRFSRTQSIARL